MFQCTDEFFSSMHICLLSDAGSQPKNADYSAYMSGQTVQVTGNSVKVYLMGYKH